DLPQPEGPTNTMNSPLRMSRSTPLITFTAPKDLRTLRSSIAAIWNNSLALDAAGGEPAHDLALEDEDENDERDRDDDRCGHDQPPRNFEARPAGQQPDRHRNRAGAVGRGE